MCVHILSLWSAAVLKLLQQGVTSLPRFISIHPLVEVDIETKIGGLQSLANAPNLTMRWAP